MAKSIAREFRASDGSVELLLTEEITQGTAERLIAQLSTFKGQAIDLSIYSHGGNAEAAFGIYDYITDAKNDMHITARVYGLAASGAMIIAAGCEKRVIGDSSFAMAHYAYPKDETANLSESDRARLDTMNERQIALFQKITGKGRVAIKQMLDEGADMNANDAVEFGLFNGIIEQAKLAALLTPKKMADKKMRVFKVDRAVLAAGVVSGEVSIPEEDIEASNAVKITDLDKQIAALTKERDDLKTAKDTADAAKVEADGKVVIEAAKVTAEVAAKGVLEAEVTTLKAEKAKVDLAMKALKENPLVAQVMPDGTSVVIPGADPDGEKNKGKTKREIELEAGANAWAAAKKEYLTPATA